MLTCHKLPLEVQKDVKGWIFFFQGNAMHKRHFCCIIPGYQISTKIHIREIDHGANAREIRSKWSA